MNRRKRAEQAVPPAIPGEKDFSVIEAARLLRVVPETIRRRIRSGHLKAVRIGLGYRIAESEIERIKREGFPFKQSAA